VFYTEVHVTYSKTNVARPFRIALEKAKIEEFCFHDIRHTFSTHLVKSGKDIYKVQRLLGHKTGKMTQRSAHHNTESLRDAVEALDKQPQISHNLVTFIGSCDF
jgi:integrase